MSFAARLLRPARLACARTRVSASQPLGRHPVFARTLITKRYTAEHETLIYDDETNIGTITLTDYAQSSLGDVVFVELPSEGTEVKQGEQIGAVESVKAASDIYAPVSGTITEVNETLGDQPGLINKSPEDAAWLCKIELADAKEFEDLLDEEAYKKHTES